MKGTNVSFKVKGSGVGQARLGVQSSKFLADITGLTLKTPEHQRMTSCSKSKDGGTRIAKNVQWRGNLLTSDLFKEVVCSWLGDRVLESDSHSLFWALQASSEKSRVFLEVECVCARVCKRACMSACMSACVGRLGLDWVNEWVSRQSITAGWPSALLWHKQKVHMAAGTHSHACSHAHTRTPSLNRPLLLPQLIFAYSLQLCAL